MRLPWSGRPDGVAWRYRSRLVRVWLLLRSRRPVTFNEKVRYTLLRDRRPLMVTYADKARMRSYVTQLVGAQHLPGLLALLDDPRDLRRVALPAEYVLKPTHGSGACVVVSRLAPADARLPPPQWGWVYSRVRPEHADPRQVEAIAAGWLAKRYGRGPNHEWAYGAAGRQLLVEELLAGPDGDLPSDCKVFVFHGRATYVQVDGGRFGARTQDFFDRDWVRLDLSGGHPGAEPPPVRPARLDQILTMAEKLSVGSDFVRVDLFDLPDRLVVGELTSSPAGGHSPFHPESWNSVFGSHWTVGRHDRHDIRPRGRGLL